MVNGRKYDILFLKRVNRTTYREFVMKEKKISLLVAIILAVLFCSGCSLTDKNENIKAGMAAIEALDYDGALANFALAKEAGENERLLYRGEGLAYMGKVQYAEAEAAFEAALSHSNGRPDSMDYDINYYLATAYYKQGDVDKAIKVYDAIIALKPEDKDAYYLRGVMYTQKGSLEQATENFDKAISLGKNYLQTAMENGTKGMTNYEKGRISFYLEDYESARNYLEKAKEEGGHEAVLFLGKTYETLGDNNYAISVYNTYISAGNANPQVLNQMGLCKMEMGDYQGALEAFQAAMNIEDNGMMQVLKLNEIVAYEMLQEYKKAAVLLESYLKTYPDDELAAREYTFLKTR